MDNYLSNNLSQVRKIVFVLFEDPTSSVLAKMISWTILLAIVLSQIQIIFDSLYDDNPTYNELSNYCEILIFIIFTLEYLIRLITYTAYGNQFKDFLFSHMNIIDLLSIAPFSIISLIYGKTSLNGLRVLKLFKVIRILKMKRYLKGMDLLSKSVSASISQFYFLIIAFLQITLAYAVVLYYSDYENNQLTFENSVWLGVVTMTTVGYGDYVPKSIVGIIVTSIVAIVANTIIFSLPIGILNIEFSEHYINKKESEQIEQLKKLMKSDNRKNSIKNQEFTFFNHRLQMIEERNKEIQQLLDQSNKVASELTKDLKRLFLSVNDDADQIVDNLNSPNQRKENVLLVKANLYDKLMRAKKKIQITNIFKNLKQESSQENIESPINQTVTISANKKSYFRMRSKKQEQRNKIGIKSHSQGNVNQLLILRNEESGELPFDFLQDVIIELHKDIVFDHYESPKLQEYKRSFIIPESSEINKDASLRINSLCWFDSPMNKLSICGSSNNQKRKFSEFVSQNDKNTFFNLQSVPISPFNNDIAQRSITEISNNNKKDTFNNKQIQEIQNKNKPKTPPQFRNYQNNLKALDNKPNSFLQNNLIQESSSFQQYIKVNEQSFY